MKLQSLIDQKRRELAKKKKRMKRKAFRLKAKFFLTCVRIQVRKAAAGAVEKGRGKQEVVQTAEKPEFITPVLVKDGSGDEEER